MHPNHLRHFNRGSYKGPCKEAMLKYTQLPITTFVMLNLTVFLFILASNSYWLITNFENYFFLFTHWNWTLLLILYLVVVIIDYKPTFYPNVLKKFKQVLIATVGPITILVCLLYWGLLSKEVWGLNSPLNRRISGFYMHTLNLVFYLLQSVNTSLKDAMYSLLVTIIYTLVIITSNQLGRPWPYEFLSRLVSSGMNVNLVALFVLVLGISVMLVLIQFGIIMISSTRTNKNKPLV